MGTPSDEKNHIVRLFCLLILLHAGSASGEILCPPLPPASGAAAVTVTNSTELNTAMGSIAPNTTVLLAPGTYRVSLNIIASGITLRSLSGSRDDVILDGEYQIGELIAVRGANDVTIADVTLRRANYHLIHVVCGSLRTRVYNVKLADAREQFIKINPENGLNADAGEVACSEFELTPAGRAHIETHPTPGFLCYTGGIDAHSAANWRIRDNRFSGIYCTNGGLAEHCIHFWSGSSGTVVERNVLVDCGRGIGFGLGDRGHAGGRIVNNFICADIPGEPGHDAAISLESAGAALVAHNTISTGGRGWNASIDHRFAATTGLVVNNLYSSFLSNRNGSQAAVRSNLWTDAAPYTARSVCDLHLKSSAAGLPAIVDRAESSDVITDIDGALRAGLRDIGADEVTVRPASPENLRISR